VSEKQKKSMRKAELRSYADIDGGGSGNAVPAATGRRRVEKRRRTPACKACGAQIKFRGPANALNLDDTPHRCGSEARIVNNDRTSTPKEKTDALKTLYKVVKLAKH